MHCGCSKKIAHSPRYGYCHITSIVPHNSLYFRRNMIGRRLTHSFQNYCSNSGSRCLSSFTAQNYFSPAQIQTVVISEKNSLFLGFLPHRRFRLTGHNSVTYSHQLNTACSMRYLYSSDAMIDLPVGGIVDVHLAQTGEGIAECELIRWFVQEGDQVDDFQPLCEVQSDKATIEITSRYKGKVAQILYVPGDIVKVGETLLKMFVEGSEISTVICDGVEIKSLASDLCDSHSQMPILEKTNNGRVLSTPAVRNLAREYGININDVGGTGKDGRVLEEDVHIYSINKGIAKESSMSAFNASIDNILGGDDGYSASHGSKYADTKFPLRGFQRTMVKTMTMAAQVPHFHYVEEIKCDALMEVKTSFQNENSDPEVKYTFLPLLIKSLSMAMSKYPLMNSCFSEESQEVILKGSHNIGIAMATPHGLVVPNIKKVQSLSIFEITKELSRLQQLALNNKLSPEDVCGGTTTLSNIGAIGGKFGSPLLNLPEVSIIALGRIQKVPHFADDGNLCPMSVMTINIGADHRVLDGATVARFCNEWKLFIEKPELLVLHMR